MHRSHTEFFTTAESTPALGRTVSGQVIVKLVVSDVPRILPSNNVCNVIYAVPDVALGISFSHSYGIDN